MSARRIFILWRHYIYSIKRNKGRLVDIFVWPVLELLVFGFTANFLNQEIQNEAIKLMAILLGSLVFWHFFAKISGEVYQQLFDDVLSKNLKNIIMSPVRVGEMIIALIGAACTKLVVSMGILLFVAKIIYGFNLLVDWRYGFLVLTLVLWGVAMGLLVSSLLFLLGNKAMTLAWVVTGIVQPFSCVFYSREILPGIFRMISYLVPSSYVFEIYREMIKTGNFNWQLWGLSIGLSGLYFLLGILLFNFFLKLSRKTGVLARI
ncbi:ABC transporter permease [Patescibacteria group bacterium]|nr:ABC transporter permease [Patescibacteria group bacterium]